MLKKLKIVLCMLGLGALCAGAAACAPQTVYDSNYQNSEVVVRWDPNGGTFLAKEGTAIIDMYDVDNGGYTPDADGNVEVKLLDPLDPSRPSGASESDNISLTMQNYSLYGWYKSREPVLKDGKPVDGYGHVLESDGDGGYYYVDESGTSVEGFPAYTYSDRWDFEEDRVVYNPEEGRVELTLYACWVPYFEFDYYYADGDEWVLYGTTSFDYFIAESQPGAEGYLDFNEIAVPDWQGGAMNYNYIYSDMSTGFVFPSRSGYTFAAAYADEDRTRPIEGTFAHEGALNEDTGTAQNRVQNIYVDFDEGTRYRIENAEQLAANGDSSGYYEILGDLDFKSGTEEAVTWPAALSNNTFTGRFVPAGGERITISNVSVVYGAGGSRGGLFGEVAAGAEIADIDFVNVTFDLANTGYGVTDSRFGLFSGQIAEGAQVSGITIAEAAFRIGNITPPMNDDGYKINLVANGGLLGITADAVTWMVYGVENYEGKYDYPFEIDEATGGPAVYIDDDGNVTAKFVTLQSSLEQEEYIINHPEETK